MTLQEIKEFLKGQDYETVRKAIAEYLIKDCHDLTIAGRIVERGYDPELEMKLDELLYDEGPENCGIIPLPALLQLSEELCNLSNGWGEKVKFTVVVRQATQEEMEEYGGTDADVLWIPDGKIDLEDVVIEFEVSCEGECRGDKSHTR